MRNITRAYNQAKDEHNLLKLSSRSDISERRKKRSKERLEKFRSEKKDQKEKMFFLFGDTYHQKEELKSEGWQWCSIEKTWWSYESLNAFGFVKIWA